MYEIIPYSDLEKMAQVMGKTLMFGKKPEELLPLMLIAQAEGKHPAIAAQEYDIIQGKPALNSRSTLARFQTCGGKIEWVERNDQKATAFFSHPQGGRLKVEWNIQRATQAGLASKEIWKKYPAQMLSARVVAEGVRAVFPACLSGMYTVEEIQDIGPEIRNVTPQAASTITIAEESEQVVNVDKSKLVAIRERHDADLTPDGKVWLDNAIQEDKPETDWAGIAIKVLDGLKERGIDVNEKTEERE